MKELSIEEKAQRYDEAIERAKEINIEHSKDGLKPSDDVLYIFPELAESEDEMIRKDIVFYITAFHNDDEERARWIAWLEKQGENDRNMKFVTDDAYQRGYDEGIKVTHEKKSEQKPADNVKPKFKNGQWIVFNGLTLYINEVVKGYYRTISINGIPNSYDWDIDNLARLWTIADAKDGDILCTYECCKPKIVFILKGTPKIHYALSYHCYYNIMYPHFASDSEKGCLAPNDEDVKPATKEQRDTLEMAITNAGYTFDFDKKELKNIEQNHAERSADDLPEFESYLCLMFQKFRTKGVCTNGEIVDFVKEHSQKLKDTLCHAWSKEDELYIRELESLVKQVWAKAEHENDKETIHKMSNLSFFLKTLKPQLKKEWSEEDEKQARQIERIVRNDGCTQKLQKQIADWFKSLKDRVQPQPKQEWSEKDGNLLSRCVCDFDYLIKNENRGFEERYKEQIDWLESLRPQWKPSEDMLEAL